MKIKVKIIPLARLGFIPISDRNPVDYYLADEQERIFAYQHFGFRTYEDAKKHAESKNYEIIEN